MASKTLYGQINANNDIEGIHLKLKSVHLPVYILNKLKKWKRQGVISSISEAIRMCIYFGYNRFHTELIEGAKIPNMKDIRIGDGFPFNNNPNIIFIQTRNGSYEKYEKVKE